MVTKRKNAPLEASNVAVLLEHIPIGATRSIHSLQVKRVEADHYSIGGGPVIDLVDAMAQIGGYSGKHSNPRRRNPSDAEHLTRGLRRYSEANRKAHTDLDAATALAFKAESDFEDAADRSGAQDAHALGLGFLHSRHKKTTAKSNPVVNKKAAATRSKAKNPDPAYIRAGQSKAKNPAAKFERGKPAGGGHREERGYFYEVLNAAGSPVALTTSKAEAQEVCDNPAMLKLPKGEYTVRHVGGKGSVPMTESKIRGRKVK